MYESIYGKYLIEKSFN
jgi:hypothetical protein